MLQLGGREFARACRAQDVGLDDTLVEVLHAPPLLDDGLPTQLLRTINAASSLLTGYPGEPLASKRDVDLTPRMRVDPVAVHLARIINYSRHPMKRTILPSFVNTCEPLDTCPEAEYHFLDTFDAIADARPTGETDEACQLIIDDKGTLMIRKNKGQPTALTLRPMAIDGVPFPAGMIVNARLAGKPNQYKSPRERVDIIEVGEVSAVSPLRLSAFGLGRFRRSIDFFTMHPYQIDEEIVMRNPNYMRVRLQDIGRIASDFLSRSQENHSSLPTVEARFA